MIIKPRIRGFMCVTAHPEGCKANVREQIDYVELDAVILSHDHYDHLDRDVVRALSRNPAQSKARFVVTFAPSGLTVRLLVSSRASLLIGTPSTTMSGLLPAVIERVAGDCLDPRIDG